jgi:hypothetical protein
MEVSGQLHALPTLPQRKEPCYPLDRRLGGRGSEEKNSQRLPGLEPPTIQSVAQSYTTEIYRLLDLREVGWEKCGLDGKLARMT